MPDPEFICLTNESHTFTVDDEIHCCRKCGEFSCPTCGGEVSTIEEYDEAMKANGT
jgi:hypothetical protein